MNPKTATYTGATATPITINAEGAAVPKNASISISNNGGADFNASYTPCTLTFTGPNGCPFTNCSNNTLSLNQGHNIESLSSNAAVGVKYTYTVSPPTVQHGIATQQYDITVSS